MKRLRNITPRQLGIWLGAIAIVVIASGAMISTSHTSITRARLERDLPRTFSNLYVQQAALLGHKGITVKSLEAKAQCDKGGSKVKDSGPGADWICYMSWNDPKNVDETAMPGKFEVNARTNNCYTAGGPSKLIGLITITDKAGNDVPNPVFEFDGCFDPNGSNKPTGVKLEPAKNAPTGPAALAIARASLKPSSTGLLRPALTCSAGQEGCGGTIAAKLLSGKTLGSVTYALAPESTGTVVLTLDPRAFPSGRKLVLVVKPVIGEAPTKPVPLTLGA